MLKLYNTLTRKKEEFKPVDNSNTVRMYSCGPTVYGYAHIGNFRAYIFMDILRRTLKMNGYNLKGVMNITDVGHLVSDADEGDDKMEKAARKENKTPYEIAEFYTGYFMRDLKKLNIETPEIVAKATEHVQDMIKFVEKLIENGYAYVVNGNVYYDVSKYSNYGALSGLDLSSQKAGARIEVNSDKRNPYDFALWIKAPENHIMRWDSPWSVGYPGWHIECSSMGLKYLGERFDIHTGGVDHIPVHHENEIAQSYGLTKQNPAHFWAHCEFLQVDNGKMSKSLGNCYTISELEERGFSALDYRFFVLNGHYRKKLNFTFEGLNASKVGRENLYKQIREHFNGENEIDDSLLEKYENDFKNAVNDDLNTPMALGILFSMVRNNKPSRKIYELTLEMDKILGIDIEKNVEEVSKEVEEKAEEIPENIQNLANERMLAKKEKNYAKADEIRNTIKELGYIIIDTPNGFEIKREEK